MEPQFTGERNRYGNRYTAGPRPAPSRDEKRMPRLALAILFLGLAPAAAAASQQGVLAIQKWKAMDLCAQQAQAAYPDFTPEANAKRDAKLKECLAQKNLPPRVPLSAPR